MKALTHLLTGSVFIIMFLPLSCQSQNQDAVKEAKGHNEVKADKKLINEDVATFLVKAVDGRLMDAKEGELAIALGSTKAIRNYGEAMVKDQALMLQRIKELAKKRNITLPLNISDDKQDGYDALALKEGEAFDEKFIKMMILDHERDAELFEKATELSDKEVSQFAKNFLPMIQGHLDTINKIKDVKRSAE